MLFQIKIGASQVKLISAQVENERLMDFECKTQFKMCTFRIIKRFCLGSFFILNY